VESHADSIHERVISDKETREKWNRQQSSYKVEILLRDELSSGLSTDQFCSDYKP